MGFQFNQVGGGTKTRRPIALRMQYNPRCSQPHCFLTLDNGKEEPRSLKEIQAYIEAENKRLENDELRCFDPREIMVRVEVRAAPCPAVPWWFGHCARSGIGRRSVCARAAD